MIIIHAREVESWVKLCTLKEEQDDYVYAISTFVNIHNWQMNTPVFQIGPHYYMMCPKCLNHSAVQLKLLASVKV